MLCDYTLGITLRNLDTPTCTLCMCLGIACFGCVDYFVSVADMASVYQQATVHQFLQDEDVHITRYTSDDVWCSAWTFQPLVSH